MLLLDGKRQQNHLHDDGKQYDRKAVGTKHLKMIPKISPGDVDDHIKKLGDEAQNFYLRNFNPF